MHAQGIKGGVHTLSGRVEEIRKLPHEQPEVEPAQGGSWQYPLPAQWQEGWKGALLQTADCALLPPPPLSQ